VGGRSVRTYSHLLFLSWSCSYLLFSLSRTCFHLQFLSWSCFHLQYPSVASSYFCSRLC
jgi:hypothetical protein